MAIGGLGTITLIIAFIVVPGASITLLVLAVRALVRYLQSKDRPVEKAATRKSLGEAIREHRTRCNMTQEFVAEALGVSRQAVSKWENGASDPSTGHLIALAGLYGIPAGDLLKEAAA